MLTLHQHLLQEADFIPSPNCDARPLGMQPQLIVMHCISLPPGHYQGQAVVDFFTNRLDFTAHPYYRKIAGMKVSSHLFIRRDGTLIQFVPFNLRAWHAGKSAYRSRPNCNDYSIGIELEGQTSSAFTHAQYVCLAEVTRSLFSGYNGLHAGCIVGHADIASGRKTDPGPFFNKDFLNDY